MKSDQARERFGGGETRDRRIIIWPTAFMIRGGEEVHEVAGEKQEGADGDGLLAKDTACLPAISRTPGTNGTSKRAAAYSRRRFGLNRRGETSRRSPLVYIDYRRRRERASETLFRGTLQLPKLITPGASSSRHYNPAGEGRASLRPRGSSRQLFPVTTRRIRETRRGANLCRIRFVHGERLPLSLSLVSRAARYGSPPNYQLHIFTRLKDTR